MHTCIRWACLQTLPPVCSCTVALPICVQYSWFTSFFPSGSWCLAAYLWVWLWTFFFFPLFFHFFSLSLSFFMNVFLLCSWFFLLIFSPSDTFCFLGTLEAKGVTGEKINLKKPSFFQCLIQEMDFAIAIDTNDIVYMCLHTFSASFCMVHCPLDLARDYGP